MLYLKNIIPQSEIENNFHLSYIIGKAGAQIRTAGSRVREIPDAPSRLNRKEREHMDYEFLMSAVSVVGFPIVAYGAMFWYMMKSQEQHSNELQQIMMTHKEETDAMKEALNQNTLALSELKNAIARLGEDK